MEMNGQRKYIYGIIENHRQCEFKIPGIDNARIYTINHRNLAAVVSDTTLKEIDPTRKSVQAHLAAQTELLKNYTLLPMSFGTVTNSETEVIRLLELNYEGLITELKRLENTIEVELKIFWDQDAMLKQLQAESQDFNRIKEKIKTAASPVESQSLLMEAGKLVERLSSNWKTKYAHQAYNVLKLLSVETCLNNPVGVKNILNASFLIDRAKEKEFQQKVYELDSQYRGKTNFKYVAPLPPYNFIRLKLMGIT